MYERIRNLREDKDLTQTDIAKILNVEIGQISIKATTEEGMGFCGKGEGSKAMAVVLLAKK